MRKDELIQVSIEGLSEEARAKRLRVLLDMVPLTVEAFCKKYGFSSTTVKYWMRAKGGGLTGKGAQRIVEATLREGVLCQAFWLMSGKDSFPQYIDVRQQKQVKKSLKLLPRDYYLKKMNEEIDLFCRSYENTIILQIYDDGMNAPFNINDYVGGILVYGNNIQTLVGDDCIVETADHQHLCRRITQGTEIDHYNLVCTNQRTTVTTPNQYNVKLNGAAMISRFWKKEPLSGIDQD